jgi:hypothetical protein
VGSAAADTNHQTTSEYSPPFLTSPPASSTPYAEGPFAYQHPGTT